jgi:hypothetical protein
MRGFILECRSTCSLTLFAGRREIHPQWRGYNYIPVANAIPAARDAEISRSSVATSRRLAGRYSRNARLIWSESGFIRYDITVRSPVLTKASTGIPGTSLTLPRRATSSGGIAIRIV